jgi:hypothetical protein
MGGWRSRRSRLFGGGGARLRNDQRPRLTRQRDTLQASALEMLADGALGNTDPVTGEEDGADLSGSPRRQLDPQCTRFVEQLGVAADGAQVGAWIGFETIQTLLAIGAQPAVERAT